MVTLNDTEDASLWPFSRQIQGVVVPNETKTFKKHSFYINKICFFYWCQYGLCWLAVATWFWTFLLVCYQCQLMEILKRKTTNKFIKHVTVNFLKLRRTFCKKIFCNLTTRLPIIFCRLHKKKSFGLVLFIRDGQVITNIHNFLGCI